MLLSIVPICHSPLSGQACVCNTIFLKVKLIRTDVGLACGKMQCKKNFWKNPSIVHMSPFDNVIGISEPFARDFMQKTLSAPKLTDTMKDFCLSARNKSSSSVCQLIVLDAP